MGGSLLQDAGFGGREHHGALWKLNGNTIEDEAHLKDIRNWRRRLTFLHKKDHGTLAYVSEKDGGDLHCICAMSTRQGKAKVVEQSVVELADMDAETTSWVISSIRSYDIAFHDEAGVLHNDEEYAAKIPEQLYVFIVLWMDVNKEEHHVTLATEYEAARQEWLEALRQF